MKILDREPNWSERFSLIPASRSKVVQALNATTTEGQRLSNVAEVFGRLILGRPNRAGSFPEPMPAIPDLPNLPNTPENNFFREVVRISQELQQRGDEYFGTFVASYRATIGSTAGGIRNRKAYSTLSTLSRRAEELCRANFEVMSVYQFPYRAVYSLACGRERFLVSAKPNPVWRNLYLREDTQLEYEDQMIATNDFMSSRLHKLEPSIAPIIPQYFLPVNDLRGLRVPESPNSVEDSLEEAFYTRGKSYIVPEEGAEVHIDNTGDLKGFRVMERGNILWASAITDKGDHFLGLDLEDGLLDSTYINRVPEERRVEIKIAKILAEVYRDLVTSVDVLAASRRGRLVRLSDKDDEKTQRLKWTFIPRKRVIRTYIGGSTESGSKRSSPRAHKVIGFKRKGNMTEAQRIKIIEFEQKTGIKVLENLPEGHTFVRPHPRPKGALEETSDLPKFIKRKIERELRESEIENQDSEIATAPEVNKPVYDPRFPPGLGSWRD